MDSMWLLFLNGLLTPCYDRDVISVESRAENMR